MNKDILICGVGGQGTVLASKIISAAAMEEGNAVHSAETIGMAQRGGSVVSHVRMGNEGEEVQSPLIARGCADVIIAFEPAEGARMLPYLAPTGVLVTATTAVQPVTAALAKDSYRGAVVLQGLRDAFAQAPDQLVIVPDDELLERIGNRKVLNTLLLAKAIDTGRLPLDLNDLRAAICACVKPAFVDLNLQAID